MTPTGSTRAPVLARARGADALAGTAELTKLTLRRDRVPLPVWIVLLTALVASTGSSYASLYGTPASRRSVVASIGDTPTLLALYGRLYSNSVGGLTAWKGGALALVAVGLMGILTVIRHTRADEESGRAELVGAGVVGRQADLTAVLLVTGAASVVLALLVGVSLIGVGLEPAGSLALGCAIGAAGCMFGALGAVAAQLSESTRTARGIALAALGAAYLLRAVGDAGPHWLSWLSPIGWCQQIRAYGDERWWVLLPAAALTAALVALAQRLKARRDVGAGLLPPTPGPPHAAARLRSPLALAWRLERGVLAAWAAGFAIFGAALGSIAESVGDLIGDSSGVEDVLHKLGGEKGLVDAYLAATMQIFGLVAAVYVVAAVLRLRAEEASGRAEPLLAAAVSRTRWALAQVATAAAGSVVVMLAAGVPAGAAHALQTGDARQLARVVAAALIQLPAAWVLGGLALALVGLAPRVSALAWAGIVLALVCGQLGEELDLPRALIDVSPFAHVPQLPGAPMSAGPVWLAALAATLGAAGLAGLRRRDIGA